MEASDFRPCTKCGLEKEKRVAAVYAVWDRHGMGRYACEEHARPYKALGLRRILLADMFRDFAAEDAATRLGAPPTKRVLEDLLLANPGTEPFFVEGAGTLRRCYRCSGPVTGGPTLCDECSELGK